MILSLLRYASPLVLWLALTIPQTVGAQSLWSKPYEPNQIGLTLLQPAIETGPDEELSFLTGAGTLWGSYLANDRTTLIAALPVAHYRAEVGPGDPASVAETAVGNPYLGLGVSSTRVPLLVEIGLRLPLAPDRNAASFVGAAADLDRGEAFEPHLLSAELLLNTRWEFSRTTSIRLRGGPLLTIPTQENASTTELFARYSAQGWYEGERYILGLGLTGRALVTEDGAFNDRTIHQAGATLIFNLPRVQPGLLVRAPLNGPRSEAVNLVVGVTLTASF